MCTISTKQNTTLPEHITNLKTFAYKCASKNKIKKKKCFALEKRLRLKQKYNTFSCHVHFVEAQLLL